MVGDLNECIARIKKYQYTHVLLRWGDQYKVLRATTADGLRALDAATAETLIGVYRQATMRAPGDVEDKVAHSDLPVDEWQKLASPVWMDINPNDTLQFRSAREHDDERHICPLQLEVIRRGIRLWTRPGDVVLTPFLGIGSEAYCAVEMGRKAIGVELKKSYFDQAVRNIDSLASQTDLFATA